MHNVWLVGRREYLERIRAKSFLIMTILIPTLMGGAITAIAFMSRSMGSGQHIAVITSDPRFATDVQTEMGDSHGLNKPVVDVYSPSQPGITATLDQQLKSKDAKLDGYLIATPSIKAGQRPNFQWVPKVQSDVITRGRVADAVRGRAKSWPLRACRPRRSTLCSPLSALSPTRPRPAAPVPPSPAPTACTS
jgi:ABC-2 type transport system permease protein